MGRDAGRAAGRTGRGEGAHRAVAERSTQSGRDLKALHGAGAGAGGSKAKGKFQVQCRSDSKKRKTVFIWLHVGTQGSIMRLRRCC